MICEGLLSSLGYRGIPFVLAGTAEHAALVGKFNNMSDIDGETPQ